MLHAGLTKKKHDEGDEDDGGEPETREERKQRKEDEKEAKHEEHKEKNKERKDKLKKNAKKGAKTAGKGAKFLPLILEPYRIEECETCGLNAYLPLSGKTKAEKEAAKKAKEAKKSKGINKKQRQKELKEKQKKKKEEDRARRHAAAEEEKKEQAKLARDAQLAREFRMGMNQVAQAERHALNKEIDQLFHALQRGRLEQLDVLVQAADARRALIVRLVHFHARFVAEFNTLPQMTHLVAIKKTLGMTAEDYQAAVVDQLGDLLVAVNKFVPPPLALDEPHSQEDVAKVARKIEDITLYLLRRTEEQRSMVETFDGALVELNAQILDFPDERGFERFHVYIEHLNRVYAFIFAYTLEEFLQGLQNAHNVTNPEARRKEQARRQRELVLNDDSDDESESYSISEEESLNDTSEEEEEEEEEEMQADGSEEKAPRRQRRTRLSRLAKDRLTMKDKRRAIMAPILFDIQGMKAFLNLEMTSYMIELVRLVAELPDIVEVPQMDQFYTALELFQFTTFVLGAQYDAKRNPDDWQPYYLEDMADEVYRALNTAVKKKKLDDQKQKRERIKKKPSGASGQEERSAEEDDDELSQSVDEKSVSEDESDENGMVAETPTTTQPPQKKPVKEKILRDKEQAEKKDALTGDKTFVRAFASTLFEIVNGNSDKTPERAAWDPQRDTRKKQSFKGQETRLKLIILEHTRSMMRIYEANVRPPRYYINATALKKLIDAAHAYIAQQAAKGIPVVIKHASDEEEEGAEVMDEEAGGAADDDNTTTASSTTTTTKKSTAKKGEKKAPAKKKTKDSPLEKLQQKVSQLTEQALVYHAITESLATLLGTLQILPGYVLQKQDPFLRWDQQRDDDNDESSDEQVDLDDDTYKRGHQVVVRDADEF